MKFIHMIWVLVFAYSVPALAGPSNDIKGELLDELLVEKLITPFEYHQQKLQLGYLAQKAKRTTKLVVNQKLGSGTASISGEARIGFFDEEGVQITLINSDTDLYVDTQLSDQFGAFSFNNLDAGNYYLRANHDQDEYIDTLWSSTGMILCQYCQPEADSIINLANAETRSGVDFDMTVGASVSGELVDATTALPVETMYIRLVNVDDMYSNWYFIGSYDGLGQYSINGIPEGNYKVYLEADVELNNEYIPELYNDIQCNACNILAFEGAGDTLALVNGVNTPDIDFNLTKGASISGVFSNHDYPSETVEELASIYLFNDANRYLMSRQLYGTNTNPLFDGSYTVGGLLPGTYFVQGGDLGREFYQRELFEDVACPWSGCNRGAGGLPVVLGANEHRLGVDFRLKYGGKISGTITDASTGMAIPPPSNGQYFVQFYNSDEEVVGGAATRPDGTYISARALPPGTYSVRTGTMFHGEFIDPFVMQKYIPGGNVVCPGITCDLSSGNVVVSAYERQTPRDPMAEAAAATVTGIDFALSPAFSFSGTITETGSATPIPDVHVLVFNDVGDFANWATTDNLGDFTVHGLPAGTYYALTNNGSNLPFMGVNQVASGGWVDILFDGTPCPGSICDVTMGDPIVLGGGSPVIQGEPNFSFGLNAGGTISGQVRNFEDQLPASGVNVNVYNSSGTFFGSYETDNSGHYMTVGFPADSYYLTTSNEGALVDVKYGGDYCVDETCNPLDAEPMVISGNETLVNKDFNLKPNYLFKSGME